MAKLVKFSICMLVSWGISSCLILGPGFVWNYLNIPIGLMFEALVSVVVGFLVCLAIDNPKFGNKLRIIICILASWGVAIWIAKMAFAVDYLFVFHVRASKERVEVALWSFIRGIEIVAGTIAAIGLSFLLDAFRKQKEQQK